MSVRKRILVTCGIAALALTVTVVVVGSLTPWGRYADDGIGIEGDCYWEFSHGKVSLVYEGGRDNDFGTYVKTNGVWFWLNDRGGKTPSFVRIHCSCLGLRFFDESGQEELPMRRRLIPFLRPRWMLGVETELRKLTVKLGFSF